MQSLYVGFIDFFGALKIDWVLYMRVLNSKDWMVLYMHSLEFKESKILDELLDFPRSNLCVQLQP
jgi:hypothetical protein